MADQIFEAMTETQIIIIEKQSAGGNLSPDTFNRWSVTYGFGEEQKWVLKVISNFNLLEISAWELKEQSKE